jgi:hypothetical protein
MDPLTPGTSTTMTSWSSIIKRRHKQLQSVFVSSAAALVSASVPDGCCFIVVLLNLQRSDDNQAVLFSAQGDIQDAIFESGLTRLTSTERKDDVKLP